MLANRDAKQSMVKHSKLRNAYPWSAWYCAQPSREPHDVRLPNTKLTTCRLGMYPVLECMGRANGWDRTKLVKRLPYRLAETSSQSGDMYHDYEALEDV